LNAYCGSRPHPDIAMAAMAHENLWIWGTPNGWFINVYNGKYNFNG
jgi:hypothetical protein